MNKELTLSEAKAKFSEIINRIIYKKERFIITKKGKRVAMVIPLDDININAEGLIKAQGALTDMDAQLDEMVDSIYEARKKEKKREVKL